MLLLSFLMLIAKVAYMFATLIPGQRVLYPKCFVNGSNIVESVNYFDVYERHTKERFTEFSLPIALVNEAANHGRDFLFSHWIVDGAGRTQDTGPDALLIVSFGYSHGESRI